MDGVSYDLILQPGGLKRSASVLDGSNAGRVKSGRMQRDIIGTFYNYSLLLNTSNLTADAYDRLYEVLTAPQDSHIVTFPYGQGDLTFEAYISNAEDVLKYVYPNRNLWGDLAINFVSMEPNRT